MQKPKTLHFTCFPEHGEQAHKLCSLSSPPPHLLAYLQAADVLGHYIISPIVSSLLSHHALFFYSSGLYKPVFSYRSHFNSLDLWCNNCANRIHCNYRITDFLKGRENQCKKADVHQAPPHFLDQGLSTSPYLPHFGWVKQRTRLASVSMKARQGHRRGNSSFGI